ncbi:MAG: FISUMP domain-containing protein, partial [Bacteroidia bacterium]
MKTLFSLLLGLSVLQAQVKEVKIGKQVWMAENLNVSTFRNGDPIPQAKTAEEWAKATENKQPACCYYENNAENGKTYGLLYNWYA